MSAKSKMSKNQEEEQQSLASQSMIKAPVKTVQSLLEEGEKYFRDKLYEVALQNYNEALDMDPGNVTFLVERASCYLKLGRNDLALQDAEAALKQNKNLPKALYEKAEALYAMSEFELALVFFHRGKKLRPDVREFQSGINKAQEAIDNCVGDPNVVKLELAGDLSYFEKSNEKSSEKKNSAKKPLTAKREKRQQRCGSQKTVKQLLGQLYADKVYLEKLLEDDRITRTDSKTGDAIYKLANMGLDFLDTRTEFWRQQKPINVRQMTANLYRQLNNRSLKAILKQLEIIDSLSSCGNQNESLIKSQRLLIFLKNYPDNELKEKIIAAVQSNIGNSYLELGNYERALAAHLHDLELSRKLDNQDGLARALENLGRVYARKGDFRRAINVWEDKLPLVSNDLEITWLNHEIGRCYLEIGNFEIAKEYGIKSLERSERINDETWRMNALVLIAQSEMKLDREQSSLKQVVENFEQALKLALKLKDTIAINALRKVIKDVKEKLVKSCEINTDQSPKNELVIVKSPIDESKRESKNDLPNDFESETSDSSTTSLSSYDEHSTKSMVNKNHPVEKENNKDKYLVRIITNEAYKIDTVYLTLNGTHGQINNLKLDKSETYDIAFRSGQSDAFTIEDIDKIGDLSSVCLSVKETNDDFKWKIESIEIIRSETNKRYEFELNECLDMQKKSIELSIEINQQSNAN